MERTEKSLERLIDKNKTHKDPLLNLDINLLSKEFGDKRFDELMSIVNKHDPMGITMLAPISEYCLEVASIIVQLDDCITKEEIYLLVLGEFERWFYKIESKDLSRYEELAEDIYDWKSKNGTRDLMAEYISKAESFVQGKPDDSYREAYFCYRLALVLDENNRGINNIVDNLEYKLFGEEPRDDFSPIFDENEDDKQPRI